MRPIRSWNARTPGGHNIINSLKTSNAPSNMSTTADVLIADYLKTYVRNGNAGLMVAIVAFRRVAVNKTKSYYQFSRSERFETAFHKLLITSWLQYLIVGRERSYPRLETGHGESIRDLRRDAVDHDRWSWRIASSGVKHSQEKRVYAFSSEGFFFSRPRFKRVQTSGYGCTKSPVWRHLDVKPQIDILRHTVSHGEVYRGNDVHFLLRQRI